MPYHQGSQWEYEGPAWGGKLRSLESPPAPEPNVAKENSFQAIPWESLCWGENTLSVGTLRISLKHPVTDYLIKYMGLGSTAKGFYFFFTCPSIYFKGPFACLVDGEVQLLTAHYSKWNSIISKTVL